VGLHILAIEQAPRQQWLMPETPADTTETEIACHYPNQTFSGGQQTCWPQSSCIVHWLRLNAHI